MYHDRKEDMLLNSRFWHMCYMQKYYSMVGGLSEKNCFTAVHDKSNHPEKVPNPGPFTNNLMVVIISKSKSKSHHH